jgi:hypothetical protein
MNFIIEQEHHMDDEDRCELPDCCKKKTIRDFIYNICNIKLIRKEVLMLCIGQFTINIVFCFCAISYQCASQLLTWAFADNVEKKYITLMALFINSMIILLILDEIGKFIKILACRCCDDVINREFSFKIIYPNKN